MHHFRICIGDIPYAGPVGFVQGGYPPRTTLGPAGGISPLQICLDTCTPLKGSSTDQKESHRKVA